MLEVTWPERAEPGSEARSVRPRDAPTSRGCVSCGKHAGSPHPLSRTPPPSGRPAPRSPAPPRSSPPRVMLPPQGALRLRCSWRSEWSLGRRWPPRVGRASLVGDVPRSATRRFAAPRAGGAPSPRPTALRTRRHRRCYRGEAEAWPSSWHGTQTSSHPPPRDRQCLEPQCRGAGETQVGARRCSACRQGQVTPAPAPAECECASVCVSGHTYILAQMGVDARAWESAYLSVSTHVRAGVCAHVTTGCRRCASGRTCLGVT